MWPALLRRRPQPGARHTGRSRAELKLHLLGPSDPPSLERFNEAARSLCARADGHRARMAQRLLSMIPAPRAAVTEETTTSAEASKSLLNVAPEV